ncbi:hypothetical protein D3C78_1838870 [compost metagenome]
MTQDGGHVGGLNFLGGLGYQTRERRQHIEFERAAYFLCTGLAASFHVSGVGAQQLGERTLPRLRFPLALSCFTVGICFGVHLRKVGV